MTTLARKTDKTDALEYYFGAAVGAVDEIKQTLGDSCELLDFWFEWRDGKPAIFYKFLRNGNPVTKIQRIDK